MGSAGGANLDDILDMAYRIRVSYDFDWEKVLEGDIEEESDGTWRWRKRTTFANQTRAHNLEGRESDRRRKYSPPKSPPSTCSRTRKTFRHLARASSSPEVSARRNHRYLSPPITNINCIYIHTTILSH